MNIFYTNILEYAVNDWKYRILSYFIILFLLIFVLTEIPFLTSGLAGTFGDYYFFVSALIDFLIILIPILLIEKIRNSKPFYFLSLNFTKKTFGELKRGFLYALIPFLLILIVLKLFGEVQIDNKFQFSLIFLLQIFAVFISALQEEILFRGWLQKNLSLKFNPVISILLTSLIFSFLHSLNPGYTILAGVNTLLAGILFGFMFERTKSLWLPVSFHFFWNLFQALMLSSNISGMGKIQEILVISADSKIMTIILGNEYGFENSILCTFILFILLLAIKGIETLNPYNSSFNFKNLHFSDIALVRNERRIQSK